MIYLGADHAGYNLKEETKKYLKKLGYEFLDLGNDKLDKSDDYPDYAQKVGEKVAADSNSKGILFCGTGSGMCVVANKIKGIRAVVCNDKTCVLQATEHLNANILCLAGSTDDFEATKKIIDVWLKSRFRPEERHIRRLKKISDLETV
jgi:ribose 5-phosphate isomerase B